jgi:phenylacetate-CoA ligase
VNRKTGGDEVKFRMLSDIDLKNFSDEEQGLLQQAAETGLSAVMAEPYRSVGQRLISQRDRISNLLRSVYSNTAAYRAIFDRWKVQPADFKQLADLQRFPIVRKEDFLSWSPEDRLVSGYAASTTFRTTSSGTSGKSLVINFDLHSIIRDTLQGVRQLVLQGAGAVGPDDLSLHYYTYPWWTDRVGDYWRSTFVSSARPAVDAASAIFRYRPSVLAGYPSAIKSLMSEFDKGQLPLKLISCNSELSSRIERDRIEDHFGCPMLDEYSSEELTRIAVEMPDGRYYVNEDAVFIEIVDPITGHPVADGQWGELVATGLLNDAMPFIRYGTGDLVMAPQSSAKPWNGISWRQLEAIGGRAADAFIRLDGSFVPSGAIIAGIDRLVYRNNPAGVDYELVQTAADQVSLSFPAVSFKSSAQKGEFVSSLQQLLDEILRCKVRLQVDEIEMRTRRLDVKRRPVRRTFGSMRQREFRRHAA